MYIMIDYLQFKSKHNSLKNSFFLFNSFNVNIIETFMYIQIYRIILETT